jgi:hypothetical protein
MTLTTTQIVPTPGRRARASATHKIIVLVVALIGSLVGGGAIAPAQASAVSQPFTAAGTVSNANASIEPGNVEAANAAFVLNPVTESSGSTYKYYGADGSLKIYATPNTNYYLQDVEGNYHRSDYAHVVVQGLPVRVNGDRYTEKTGVEHFVANSVFNPPPPPSTATGGSRVPTCGSDTNPFHNRVGNFALVASITSLTAHYPCTTTPKYPGGIVLGNFQTSLAPLVAQGVNAYGGSNLEVYHTPATKFILGDKTSDYNHVVKRGQQVFVTGTYTHEFGSWLFYAKIIWTPGPPPAPTATTYYTDRTDIRAAATTDGAWQGTSTTADGHFPNGQFQSNLVWSQNGTDWTVSGTWVIFDGNGNALRGNLTGYTSGTFLDMTFEITSGEGTQINAQGGGDLSGTVNPSPPGIAPSAFEGKAVLQEIFPAQANG